MSLDFEKPIIELENKLNQMKDIAAKNGKSLDNEALSLEDKIIELKKEIFSNLTVAKRYNYQDILIGLIFLIIYIRLQMSSLNFTVIE
ncbi:MAG: hypothetical protein CM15mP41_0110 [Flammeovirgaceae bacterium]|nr:MAG: hypothetical protein CM15mP41_0110 [Flammeovirgaceae bacterium]